MCFDLAVYVRGVGGFADARDDSLDRAEPNVGKCIDLQRYTIAWPDEADILSADIIELRFARARSAARA